MQRGFREVLDLFKVNKKSDHPYILIEQNEKTLTAKTMNLLTIQGGELNYLQSKDYMKLLQSMIIKQFETNPILIKKYQELNYTMHQLVENLSHSFGEFSVEFEFTELLMEPIWKMLNIHIENEETKKMTTFDFRKLQIDSWLKLSNPDSPYLVIYHFPENDATINEIKELVAILKNKNITMLCISNSFHFIECMEKDALNLVKKNGRHYDINQLELELNGLNIEKHQIPSSELVVPLAFFDFIDYTKLLDFSWKNFISSSKF